VFRRVIDFSTLGILFTQSRVRYRMGILFQSAEWEFPSTKSFSVFLMEGVIEAVNRSMSKQKYFELANIERNQGE
jgi:hypothetical protein